MRKCSICGSEKEEEDFWKRNNRKSGLNTQCKDCLNAIRKERKAKNPDKYREVYRDWQERNRDKTRENALKYQRNNPQKVNEAHRLWYEKNRDAQIARRKELEEENPGRISQWQKKHQSSDEAKRKQKSRRQLFEATKREEIIKPLNCQICSVTNELEAHHHDYSKPFDVIWVCRKCHGIIHRK